MSASVLQRIRQDERYLSGLDWGTAAIRVGHPEGSIRNHIQQLEHNLAMVEDLLPPHHLDSLRLLIHTHDTFKSEAGEGVPLASSRSHASIAAKFLEEYECESDIVGIARFHDTPMACWSEFAYRGIDPTNTFIDVYRSVTDSDLFATFLLIDGLTEGKHCAPLEWSLARFNQENPLGTHVGEVFGRLRVNSRTHREETHAVVPVCSEQRIGSMKFRALGPTETWGADIYIPSHNISDLRTTLQRLVEIPLADGSERRYAGVLIPEDHETTRFHLTRYPRRENLPVPPLAHFREGFHDLTRELGNVGLLIRGEEEVQDTQIGGQQRAILGLREEYAEDRVATTHSAEEVEKLKGPDLNATIGSIISVAPNNSLYEEECVVLEGIGTPARKAIFAMAVAFRQARFTFESLTARETKFIELPQFLNGHAAG